MPATLQLGIAAILIGLLIGVPVAILSALHPGSGSTGCSAAGVRLPSASRPSGSASCLILLFAVELRWLPSASAYVSIWEQPGQAMRNLLLPALTLGVYVSGIFARFLRAALLGELHADYVRTARAKGLPERDVIGRHVMRNALLPFVTIVGLMLASFIGGALVTEAVFTYPGSAAS